MYFCLFVCVEIELDFRLVAIAYLVCCLFFTEEDNFIKCFTWLDGNDSDKFPGLIEDTY